MTLYIYFFETIHDPIKSSPWGNYKMFQRTCEKIKMFDFDGIKILKYIEGIKHPYKCTNQGSVRL
jgi:hypothetical protein